MADEIAVRSRKTVQLSTISLLRAVGGTIATRRRAAEVLQRNCSKTCFAAKRSGNDKTPQYPDTVRSGFCSARRSLAPRCRGIVAELLEDLLRSIAQWQRQDATVAR